jgi:TolB-like protein/Tfp pilus assembly protein PilF
MGEQTLKNIERPVRVFRLVAQGAAPQVVAAEPALTLPEKPSLVVLPFQNMSGDVEQDYFADGMVEDITTALSRIPWLFVIARNSAFTYKGRTVDVREVGRTLGVRYVVEGSVRRAGERLRITAQLIEAQSGQHIWADRFDGVVADVFDLQDQVTVRIASTIEPTLQEAEIKRATRHSGKVPTAYDLYLRALSLFSGMQREGLPKALELLARAVELDSGFSAAIALMAEVHVYRHANGWAEDVSEVAAMAVSLARRAILVGSDDADALGRSAYALGFFGEDIDASIALIDRALELNGNSADLWRRSGLLRLYAGRCDESITHLERSLRLDPRAVHAHQWTGIGRAHFFERRYDEAETHLRKAIQELPSYVTPRRFLTAVFAHQGRRAEAEEALRQLRGITPKILGLDTTYTEETRLYRVLEHEALLVSGLRIAAGIPE